jgi:hypothetical protein
MALIAGNIPEDLRSEARGHASAFEAFNWVASLYIGGTNTEVNDLWVYRLENEQMSNTETLNSYVGKKIILKNALIRNGHKVTVEPFVGMLLTTFPLNFYLGSKLFSLIRITRPSRSLQVFSGAQECRSISAIRHPGRPHRLDLWLHR